MRVPICAILSCLLNAMVHGDPPDVPGRPAASVVASRANNRFTLDLYGRLSKEPGNFVISAYGVSTALSMVRAGLTGDVAGRFDAVLARAGEAERSDTAPVALAEILRRARAAPPPALTISNHAWHQKGLRRADAFADAAPRAVG